MTADSQRPVNWPNMKLYDWQVHGRGSPSTLIPITLHCCGLNDEIDEIRTESHTIYVPGSHMKKLAEQIGGAVSEVE